MAERPPSPEVEPEPVEELKPSTSPREEEDEVEEEDDFDLDSIITESAFWHVEASRENGFEEGMKVEILYEDDKYWYATIVTNFGQLLSLEWCGSTETFSHDIKRNTLFELGSVAKLTPAPAESSYSNDMNETMAGISELQKLLQEDVAEPVPKVKGIQRIPPSSLNLTEEQMAKVIEEIESIDINTLPPSGFSTELFKEGMILECDLVENPTKKWFVTVTKNVGGRLLLKWLLPEEENSSEFWLFFCHPRIHIVEDETTYTDNDIKENFQPPINIEDWMYFAKDCLIQAQTEDVDPRDERLRKAFLKRCQQRRPGLIEVNIMETKVGDSVLLFPSDVLKLVPATVDEKIGDTFLRIKSTIPIETSSMDSIPTSNEVSNVPTPEDSQATSADSSQDGSLPVTPVNKEQPSIETVTKLSDVKFTYPIEDTYAILPFSWAEENEIPLELTIDHLDVASYLKANNTRAAPIKIKSNDLFVKQFKSNGRIEVVHPDDPSSICEGVVIRITPPLIWIQISEERIRILPFNSTEMFPSGFAESNGTQLTKLLPTKYMSPIKNKGSDLNADDKDGSLVSNLKSLSPTFAGSKSWCPRIYFNYKCFTGPSLSKSKLCNLPRFVGPGPVLLVMQEVISKILSIAYVSSRILNDLASDSFQELLDENDIYKIEHVQFKAKYNNSNKTTRLDIPVIRSADKVDEYCHILCSHLKCCFNLFGPKLYDGDNCPSNCRGLTKSNKVLKKAAFYREQAAAVKLGQTIDLAQLAEGKSNVKKLAKRTASAEYDPFDLLGKKKPKTKEPKTEAPVKEESQSGSENDDSQNDNREDDGDNQIKQKGRPSKKRTPSESKENTPSKKKKGKWGGDRRSSTYNGGSQNGSSQNGGQYDNPLNWTIDTVYNFIRKSDCSVFASLLKEQEIDGAAFMLLDYDTIASNILTGYTLKFNHNDIQKLSNLVMRMRNGWFRNGNARR